MGLLTAFVAALAYGVGTILQARSVEGLAAAGPEASWGRRLNLLLYLNEGWQEDWGGAVELWDPEVKVCHENAKRRRPRGS